ncbi:MAG TPA: hypothetical protein PLV13_05060 [Ilumatobacteraceae bacterium]|nr:hypothetical protein [Ilumatobacteraceae bacterium]
MRRVAAIVVAAGLLVACSDDSDNQAGGDVTTSSGPAVTAVGNGQPPLVDQIDEAIAALEAQLGGPQQYFEVNATAQLVNLFVALNNGAVAQPWVYVGGELTSAEGQAASGGTFTAADLDFDPDLVLSKISAELPGAALESFYVNGDGKGNVQYGVLVTSAQGGGLDVLVGPDGAILSVDPVN